MTATTTETATTANRGRRTRSLNPAVVGGILALGAPIGFTAPSSGLDPSWRLGLSWAAAHSIPAGKGIVFTYGPMGFLAVPNIVWRPGLILGIAYVLGATFALYSLAYAAIRRWTGVVWGVVATAVLAVGVSYLGTAPELAALALVLWAWRLLEPSRLHEKLPPWVPCALGALAALQLLVKVSVGVFGLGVAILVVVCRPERGRNLLLMFAVWAVSIVVLFLTMGQSLSDFPTWFGRSTELAGGYSSAMAVGAGFSGARYWLFLAIVLGTVVFGGLNFWRVDGRRSVPALVLGMATAWFAIKTGYVRLDASHAAITFIALAVLLFTLPWPRRWVRVGGVATALALLSIVAVGSTGSPAGRVREFVEAPIHNARETLRAIRSAVDTNYRDQRLVRSQRVMSAEYDVPPNVVGALRGHPVHADPWEISAVWTYALSWHPAPIFQDYAAYTDQLDNVNRDALRKARPYVLHRRDASIDGRFPAWDSPNYMVELSCGYTVAAGGRTWQALAPVRSHCREPRPLGRVTLSAGASVRVPTPSDPQSIVVARFKLPDSLIDRVAAVVLKPLRFPSAALDGKAYRFVPGTEDHLHLLAVPDRVGGARLANGGLHIERLSFDDADGDVEVRFYEIPTRS